MTGVNTVQLVLPVDDSKIDTEALGHLVIAELSDEIAASLSDSPTFTVWPPLGLARFEPEQPVTDVDGLAAGVDVAEAPEEVRVLETRVHVKLQAHRGPQTGDP